MPALEDLAAVARGILAAAVSAAHPGAMTAALLGRALDDDPLPPRRPHWIIALGKAAPAMAREALAQCALRDLNVKGGIIVGTSSDDVPADGLVRVAGDHPVPGAASAAAADRLAALCDEVTDGCMAIVLVSGGTSSLIGAPVAGITPEDLARLHLLLLGSGLDIGRMNAVRKRFSRWGAGRLAAALAPAEVQSVLLSDVPGDDPAAIGSGPCAPDPTTATDVEKILRDAGIAHRIPLSVASHLGAVRAGSLPETPKAGSPVFAHVRRPVIGGNRGALAAAARQATLLGIRRVLLDERPLVGDAADAGRALARAALDAEPGTCIVRGGETTIALPAVHGVGGRNQQLALAAARFLADGGSGAPRVVLLAAGTDGRDGPTDTAGAIVTNSTWEAIRSAGLDPEGHLERCDAYPALAAAGALVRTAATGTNVADIVIALRA